MAINPSHQGQWVPSFREHLYKPFWETVHKLLLLLFWVICEPLWQRLFFWWSVKKNKKCMKTHWGFRELDLRTGNKQEIQGAREGFTQLQGWDDGGGWECYLQGSKGQQRGFNSLPVSAAGMTKLLSLSAGIHIHPSHSHSSIPCPIFRLFLSRATPNNCIPIQKYSCECWHVASGEDTASRLCMTSIKSRSGLRGCLLWSCWSEWEVGVGSDMQLRSRTKLNHLVQKRSHISDHLCCLYLVKWEKYQTMVWFVKKQDPKWNKPKTQGIMGGRI